MPFFRSKTRVLAVPKSMAKSDEKRPRSDGIVIITLHTSI
jgi:hypothetical protein